MRRCFVKKHTHCLMLNTESCKESEMEECPKELIRLSHLIKGGISAAKFLEEYSNGNIH